MGGSLGPDRPLPGNMLFRRSIFWCHLIAGLIVGAVIFVMAVTGILLAFEPQIVSYFEKSVREVTVPAQAERMSLNALVDRAAEEMPGHAVGGFMVKSDPKASIAVNFGREGGTRFVNPYTGDVLGGESKMHDWMHFIEDIHRKLALGDTGKLITGICNIAFLFMLISGLYLWWPRSWQKNTFEKIGFFNSKLKGRSRDWNWHNVIGFWCSPLLLLTILTGMIMSFAWANNLLFRAAGSEPPPPMQRPQMAPQGGENKGPGERRGGGERGERGAEKPALPDFDLLIAAANDYAPGWQSAGARFGGGRRGPQGPGISLTIVEKDAPGYFARSQLTLDPKTGEVLKWEPFSELPRGRQWRSWVKVLHTGEWGGVLTQLLALLGALGAAVLVWTGFALAWYRFFAKKN